MGDKALVTLSIRSAVSCPVFLIYKGMTVQCLHPTSEVQPHSLFRPHSSSLIAPPALKIVQLCPVVLQTCKKGPPLVIPSVKFTVICTMLAQPCTNKKCINWQLILGPIKPGRWAQGLVTL